MMILEQCSERRDKVKRSPFEGKAARAEKCWTASTKLDSEGPGRSWALLPAATMLCCRTYGSTFPCWMVRARLVTNSSKAAETLHGSPTQFQKPCNHSKNFPKNAPYLVGFEDGKGMASHLTLGMIGAVELQI